jgi:hypothetical protein
LTQLQRHIAVSVICDGFEIPPDISAADQLYTCATYSVLGQWMLAIVLLQFVVCDVLQAA